MPGRGTARRRDGCCSRTSSPPRRATAAAILCETGSAIAFVPYFARYAYEVYVAPKRARTRAGALDDSERRDLATVLRDIVIRFDNLWRMPFPYVMVLHQAPIDGGDYRGFHFHIEFHPPLRQPNLLKYLAGPEIGGRQLPVRHLARGEGRGAAAPPAARITGPSTADARRASRLRSCALHARIRGDVVAACERGAVDALRGDRARRRGRHHLRGRPRRGRRAGRGVRADDRARDAPCVLVAEGLPGGEVVLPRGADARACSGPSSSIRSTARAA